MPAKKPKTKTKPKSWTVRHFSQANPADNGRADVPGLLRLVADSIETYGNIEVQDITFHTEITEDGLCHSLTVYFHYEG